MSCSASDMKQSATEMIWGTNSLLYKYIFKSCQCTEDNLWIRFTEARNICIFKELPQNVEVALPRS